MSQRRAATLVVAAMLLLLFGGRWLALRFTEAEWFASLGLAESYRQILVRRLLWQLAAAGTATLWFAGNLLMVARSIRVVELPRRVADLEIAESVPGAALRWLAAGLAILLGILSAATVADAGALAAFAREAAPIGLPEPILGRDAAFYVATLPLLGALRRFAGVLVLLALGAAIALYALTGGLSVSERRLHLRASARLHIGILAALLAVLLAWGAVLESWATVSGAGQGAFPAAAGAAGGGGGFSYVDRTVRIPALTVLAGVCLLVAAGTLVWIRVRRASIPIALWSGLLASALVGRYLLPRLVPIWQPEPPTSVVAALDTLRQRYARAAYGLEALITERLDATPAVRAESLAAAQTALAGVSAWAAPEPLLEELFRAVVPGGGVRWTTALDRYDDVAGEPRLVGLGVQETDYATLLTRSPRPDWRERHRGALAWGRAPLALDLGGVAPGGGPSFLDALDPVGGPATAAMPLTRVRRIGYVGSPSGFAVAGPDDLDESERRHTIRVGGALRRLLLAWALQAPPLMGSGATPRDRLLLWRDVPGRLRRLFPAADFSPPLPVVDGDRLLWVADGFLVADHFPLADRVWWRGRAVGLVRAAYIAVVDAQTGETRFFSRPPALSLAPALARAARVRLAPARSLPPAVRAHLRYPPELLAALLPVIAPHAGGGGGRGGGGGEDGGQDGGAGRARGAGRAGGAGGRDERGTPGWLAAPWPALLRPPGTARADLWTVAAFTDATGRRLAGFILGRSDSAGALELRRLDLPPASDLMTPRAAERRLAASPAVAAAVGGEGGEGGDGVPTDARWHGPLLAAPVAGSVAYAQAFFRDSAGPRLRGVAVLLGDRVGFGIAVADAVASMRRPERAPATDGARRSLAQARLLFLELDAARRRGDWAAFGRAYEGLRRLLEAAAPSP